MSRSTMSLILPGAATAPWMHTVPPQEPSLYVLVTLQRLSLDIPWGLTLSMFGEQQQVCVVIGGVHQKNQMLLQTSFERYCHVDPCVFWDSTGQGANVMAWTSFLMSQPPSQPTAKTSSGTAAAASRLFSGDVILAVNGCSVRNIASSLKELTSYLRQRKVLTLLVYRNRHALTAAAAAATSMPTTTMVPAVTASQAAYRVIREQYFRSFSPVTDQPLVPVVTPPRYAPQLSYASPMSTLTSSSLFYHSTRPPFHPCQSCTSPKIKSPSPSCTVVHRNPLFTEAATGKNMPFDDDKDDWELEFLAESHLEQELYIQPIYDFSLWLDQRKQTWRKRYRIHALADENDDDDIDGGHDTAERLTHLAIDYWSSQGYSSWEQWLSGSTRKWKQSYSWNQQKRRKLVEQCEQVVSLDDGDFRAWLKVRKNQWLVLQRKRRREAVQQLQHGGNNDTTATTACDGAFVVSIIDVPRTVSLSSAGAVNHNALLVDAMLDEQEKIERELKLREPLNLLYFFDEQLGVPDDILAHTIRYLEPVERPNLLAICRKTRQALCKREEVWRQLCESHWKLPRRPRKPWHDMYFSTLRVETEKTRMRVDGLLSRASTILLKADHLQAIEKLVYEGERDDAFDINYSSGVVCERNSLLNLAVIHQRHKVVRWLVESKGADIESTDRGQFTPLLNAAWAGNRYLVRYFLQKGADRSKLGRCHYTKPLAPMDFQGLDASNWAERRGHHDVAKLIRIGL